MTIPFAGRPENLSFLKPNYSWPEIHPVVSDQGRHTFLYGRTKQNREGGGKEKNKHGLGSAPSARGGRLWQFMQLSVHLQAIDGEYLRETFTKPRRMLTHLLTALLPSSHYLLLLTVSYSGLLSQAHWSLQLFFVNCLSRSSLGHSFPPPLPVSQEISSSGLLCGFHAKGILRPTPTQTETNSTHRVTKVCSSGQD